MNKVVAAFLFLFHCSITATSGLRCMNPSDARLITTAINIPDDWINTGWHTGAYLSTQQVVSADQHGDPGNNRGVIFTSDGTRLWWLENKRTGAYYMITVDQTKILCAHTVGGLRIDWFENTESNREEDWCQWDVDANSSDVTMFRLKNHVFVERMPEVGFAYFDKTGIYFDYNENADNDIRNAIGDARKWFKWKKADASQRDFASIEEECVTDPSGLSHSIESTGDVITVRSAGRRRKTNYFVSSNRLATCGAGWFLHGNKCYRVFKSIVMSQSRGKRICSFIGGKLVVPKSQAEQSFLVRLLRLLDRNGTYWLGIERQGTERKFRDEERNYLTYRRWAKVRNRFSSDKCVYWKRRRWYPATCNAQHKLACAKKAIIKSSFSCGKIQESNIDTLMRRAAGRTRSQDRIVNGIPAEEGQFPWQASIRFKTPVRSEGLDIIHNCGGTLIDECWVLTAAHCVPERDETIFNVRLGDLNNEVEDGTEQEFNIDRIIVHEEYTMYPSPRFDIALLRLAKKRGKCAKFNRVVQPACLPKHNSEVKEGDKCQVSGWGVTNTSLGQTSAAANLQWVTLPKLRNDLCRSKYNMRSELFLDDVMICAGLKRGGQDACTGDSGGPYVCRNKAGKYSLVGVVSFGIGCARRSYPGVYTNVAHFIPWITAKISANGGGSFVV